MTTPSDKLALAVAAITPETILDTGEFDFYSMRESGVVFTPDTPFEVWEQSVKSAATVYEGSGKLNARSFCVLIDALIFGESAYGEKYAQAIDATRQYMAVSVKRIENSIRALKRIEPSRRREGVTPAHYDVIYALPDPREVDELIQKVVEENLTVSALKEEVKTRHPKTSKGTPRGPKKAIIDLESEEGLAHASEKIAEWFQAREAEINAKGSKELRFKDWPATRRMLWASLAEHARIARNMGLTGQDKGRRH